MTKRFRIAFSFAGEKRHFVAEVARVLAGRLGAEHVLYDKFHEAELARTDLSLHLSRLYFEETELLVVVLSRDFDKKEWRGLEWSAIYEALRSGRAQKVLLCRFDHVEGVGLYGLAGFLELDDRTPEATARLILARLAIVEGQPADRDDEPARRSAEWPERPPAFEWHLANQFAARAAFAGLVVRGARDRILPIRGPTGVGKSLLTRQFLGNALRIPQLRCGRLDFRGLLGMGSEVAQLADTLGLPGTRSSGLGDTQLIEVVRSLQVEPRPTLLIFDTVETAGRLWQAVEDHVLAACVENDWLRIVIAGQWVPPIRDQPWAGISRPALELRPPTADDWFEYGRAFRPDLPSTVVATAYTMCNGNSAMLGQLFGPEVAT